jgi:hypothetical protein
MPGIPQAGRMARTEADASAAVKGGRPQNRVFRTRHPEQSGHFSRADSVI